MPEPVFKTPRLALTPLSHADTGLILELLNTPGWLQFIGDRNVHTERDAQAYLDNGPLTSYRKNGFGLWRVDLQAQEKPIGMCGLLKRTELEGPDLGFALLPEYSRQGYGNEAAAGTIQYAREVLRLSELLAIVQSDNEASIGLLKKNGFVFEKMVNAGVKMELLQLYRLQLPERR